MIKAGKYCGNLFFILSYRLQKKQISTAPLNEKEKLALRYAEVLTRAPSEITELMVKELKNSGFDDGEILEINQVSAYFNYANRTVLGLGCTTDGDIIGLSPNNSDNPNDWAHS